MRRLPPSLALLCVAAACGSDSSSDSKVPAALTDQALSDYEKLVSLNYAAALTGAQALKAAVDAFVAAPSELTQKAAQDAWVAARVPYGPSEAFRFYEGPIDNEKDGPEGLMNSWPLDEAYLDYTRDTPNSGIINDPSKPLDAKSIADLNQPESAGSAGENEISTGYHAIEFLLWGQDDEEPGHGAGKRKYTDYVTGAGGTAANQQRRGEYLKTITALLVADLQQVADAWKPGAAYPTQFLKDRDVSLGNVLKAIGSLAKAEVAGERMSVAYVNRSQEDEQSCFSDNTAADLWGDGIGIQNVWLGRYDKFDGVGIDQVVGAVDAQLAATTTADVQTAVDKLKALVDLQNAGKPLDVVIQAADGSPERVAMRDAIQALKKVGDDVERAAVALGLKVEFTKPSKEGAASL